ncbi:MAG: hypothetical protein LKE51_12475 [Selenomonas sp.]|jgi:hypothetical protein|nr:hypothetical protein [Selenomonas sp.]
MESLFALLIIILVLIALGIPLTVAVAVAFVASVLVLALWVGVALFKVVLLLIPTAIVGIIVARVAERLGMPRRKAENVGLAATLPCLYYFFFS